ncbi:MAG: hypothetical protein JNK85_01095 [Verrucomicrobiales bacterium]|nr:hypothetical protein [Verrucomicrobiales bacterium]
MTPKPRRRSWSISQTLSAAWLGLIVFILLRLPSFAAFELINDTNYHPGAALNGPKALVRATDGKIWMIEDTASEAIAPRGMPGRPRDTVVRLAADGTLDSSYTPWRIYGQLTFLSPTPDGGVLVGGEFPTVASAGIARIRGNGTTAAFTAQLPDTARHAVAQSSGKVVVLLETNCTRVLRLNADGSRDDSFHPITLAGCGVKLAVQSDDRILALGTGGLQRFLPDGLPDASFASSQFDGPSGFAPVDRDSVILPEENGHILVSGHFDTVNGLPRSQLVRLLADGTVDPDFVPPSLPRWGSCLPDGCGAQIYDLHSAEQGRYWVLGAFEQTNAIPARALLRLNANGSVDPMVTGIKPLLPGTVGSSQPILAWLGTMQRMVPLADGRLLVGVHSVMVDVWGQPDVGMATGLACVFGPELPAIQLSSEESDGVEDSGMAWIEVRRWGPLQSPLSFRLQLTTNDLPNPAVPGSDFLPLPDSLRFEAGEWNKRFAIPLVADGRAEPDKSLRAILSDPNPSIPIGHAAHQVVLRDDDRVGSPDPAFRLRGEWPQFASSVDVLPNGNAFVVGREGTASNLVALWATSDGQLLRRWTGNSATERLLFAAPLDNGNVLAFVYHQGESSTHPLLILRADSTPDPGFRPPIGLARWSQIQRLVNLPGGKFLLLGAELMNDQLVGRLALLDTTGQTDPEFQSPDFGSGIPTSAVVDTEGRLLVAGTFTNIHQIARPGLARLNPNGSLDDAYTPPAGLNAKPDPDVAVLALQRDGKALIRVATVTFGNKTTSGIVRLLADGSVDLDFIQGRGGQGVGAAVVLPDQRILVGGTFPDFHGVVRARLAMLLPTGAIDDSFKVEETATPHFTSLSASPDGWVWVGGWHSNEFPYVFDAVAKACVVRLLGWQVPRLVAASNASSTGGQLTFTTKPGAPAYLESSSDLFHWQTVRTNLTTDGTLTVEGFRDPGSPNQFLRLRSE